MENLNHKIIRDSKIKTWSDVNYYTSTYLHQKSHSLGGITRRVRTQYARVVHQAIFSATFKLDILDTAVRMYLREAS